MVGLQGELHLVDFGLAAEAGSNDGPVLCGTPPYMAPEACCYQPCTTPLHPSAGHVSAGQAVQCRQGGAE